MNYSTYRFTLDLRKHESQMSIAVFAHDTAVRLCISLTDGGIPYHIEEGSRAVLYGKRPDDSPLINNCMIDDIGRIIYDFNEHTASQSGITRCHIRLYGADGELISAPRFIIVAEERLVTEDDLNTIEDPLGAIDALFVSEQERKTAEIERTAAEHDRESAEEERKVSEQARVDAEQARVDAEIERTVAEDQRKQADESRGYLLADMQTLLYDLTGLTDGVEEELQVINEGGVE